MTISLSAFEKPDWGLLASLDNTPQGVFFLSSRDTQFLFVAIDNYKWKTRFFNTGDFNQDDNDSNNDTLLLRLITHMDVCALVVECLADNDSALSNALKEFIQKNTDATVGNTPAIFNDNAVIYDGDENDCDYDVLFGSIRAILSMLNVASTDAYESIEVISNVLEGSEAVLRRVPWFGQYVNLIPEYLDWTQETVAEGYAGAYTIELYNTMSCDIFCMVKDSCELNFSDIADYFAGKVGLSLDANTPLQNLIDDIVTGVWAGEQIVYATHFVVCAMIAWGQDYFGVDGAYLATIAKLGIGYPDDDWGILCVDCPEPQMLYAHQWNMQALYQHIVDVSAYTTGSFELRCSGWGQWGDNSNNKSGKGDALYWYLGDGVTVQKLSVQNSGLYINNVSPANGFNSEETGNYIIPCTPVTGNITLKFQDVAYANNVGILSIELWWIP